MSIRFENNFVFLELSGAKDRVKVNASTLRAAIDEVDKLYPGFRKRVMNSDGTIRYSLEFYVRDAKHSYYQGISNVDQTLPDNAEIVIELRSISGG